MLINGQSLPLQIVKLAEKEKALWEKQNELMDKFESAENCGNAEEMQRIGSEGAKLDRKIQMFFLEKITIFSMAISNNPNFKFN
jgi:hypothetical protein